MRPFYLSNRIPWFGAHTGYEQLPAFVRAEGVSPRVISPKNNFLARAAGKAVSLLRGHGRISQSDAAARLRLELALRRNRDGVGHILYGEEHLPYWRDASPGARRRTLLTLHQPGSQWKEEKIRSLAGLPRVIVLWRRELDWFREKLGGGEVDFIPHGVDLDFFSPLPLLRPPAPAAPRRLLYVGVHLRNTAMLGRLVEKLGGRDLEFDFLVPAHRRSEPELAALAGNRRVRWHDGLDDGQLRELYRAAHLLLLPLNNSGANTAVVEALACGLPVVTTDVGGIRDYGGGTVFPVVENNDDEGMLALIGKYLDEPGGRDEAGRRCRAFAEAELGWPRAARRHVEIYRKALA